MAMHRRIRLKNGSMAVIVVCDQMEVDFIRLVAWKMEKMSLEDVSLANLSRVTIKDAVAI